MTITSVDLANEALCRDLYLNFYKYKNTRQVDDSVIQDITLKYGKETLARWEEMACDDENVYEFTDEDWDDANASGKSQAQAVSGTDGDRTASNVHTAGDGAGVVGAAGTLGTFAGHGLFKNIGHFFDKTQLKASLKGNPNGATNAGACAYVAAALVIAVAALYYVKRPNKEEIEALRTLSEQYEKYKADLVSAQGDADKKISEMEGIMADSAAVKDSAEKEVSHIVTFEDFIMRRYERIQADKTAGVPLSKEDQDFLASIDTLLAPYASDKKGVVSEASAKIGENIFTVEGFQTAFDAIATQIGETQGITDFAASFDKATMAASIAEAFNQGGNAIAGVLAAAQLIGLGPWNLVLAAATLTASGFSVAHMIEQIGYATDAQVAIKSRGLVEDEIDVTTESYNENLTYLEGGLDSLKANGLINGEEPEEGS